MLTLKQIEAVYWVAELGTFGAAAEKLNTTTSAISKRIGELEDFLRLPLFDRSRRIAQLTPKGRELLECGEQMLQTRDRLLERMGKPVEVARRFRLGITELIALTFLPGLLQEIRANFPAVSLEPEIDLSTHLSQKLSSGEIDCAIMPMSPKDPRFTSVPLKRMELAWMCSPSLITTRKPLSLDEIANYPILMQIETSGVDAVYERWFRARNVTIRRAYAGNSLMALSALTIAGFGISYLPALYFRHLVEQGLLRVVRAQEAMPMIRYYAVYRSDANASFGTAVAELARQLCDFSRPELARSLN